MPTPPEIAALVQHFEDAYGPLHDRMEADYGRWRLDEFGGAGDDYEVYTSNEPRTYAGKIVGWCASARRIVRVLHQDDPRVERELNDIKEQFVIGVLRSADQRLRRLLEPELQDQLAWYICIRGLWAVQAMLVKRPDFSTYVDISPWDPRYTSWQTDSEGLVWACNKVRRTQREIAALFPGTEFGATVPTTGGDGIWVYNYHDRWTNTICTATDVLKPPTPHGCPRVPVTIGVADPQPLVQSDESDDTIEDWAESVYQSNRDVYDKANLMMSIILELVSRTREPPTGVTSRQGDKTLEKNPWKSGSEVALAEGEKVEPLDLIKTTPDWAALTGLLSGEIQRGGLPHSIYGDLKFQLSGFAINTLRQGVDTQVRPRITAMERALTDISNLLVDQFLTGAFDAISLSGFTQNRKYFNVTITPQQVAQAGELDITLVPVLPQDDTSKMGMAQMAREGPTPLLPDIYIRDQILGLQDADDIEDTIKEQLGEKALPEAFLYTTMRALEERGRTQEAAIYFGELVLLVLTKMGMNPFQAAQMAAQASGSGQVLSRNGGTGGAGPGVMPQVMPNAMMGVPPPTPTPQAGPNVPPGQPRPGAQSSDQRLMGMGLFPPR